MVDKYSIASKKRWSRISRAEKFKRMSIVSHGRWDKVSVEDRRANAMRMVEARKAKLNKI